MTQVLKFFATTAKGMEPLLAAELKNFGAQKVQEDRAGVSFEGDLEVAYRACLGSRIANRVLLPLKSFHARSPEELYRAVQKIDWSTHLHADGTLAVDFSTSHSNITHSKFGALKVKDAIVDQFREKTGGRPSVNVETPDVRVNVYLHKNSAVLSLDLSGDSLHRRGWREEGSKAPLKENLASAILTLADWPEVAARGGALVDPMCGSGTLPIEGALMATGAAPGLARTYFGFLGWRKHDPELWSRIKEEARTRAEAGAAGRVPKIIGYDHDFRSVRTALANLDLSGMRGKVHIEKREFSGLEPVAPPKAVQEGQGPQGIVVVNPPYGERLGEIEELKPLYKEMGDVFKQRFKGWNAFIFTGNPELAKAVGLKASRRFVLYNGPIECRLLKYELY